MVTPQYTITQAFVTDERGFLWKAVYNMIVMQHTIWTYYGGFCFMEALMIASGLGYTETEAVVKTADGKESKEVVVNYNSIRSVDIWAIQTCYEQETFSRSWNMSIHSWIKYYVFIRLMDKKKRTF